MVRADGPRPLAPGCHTPSRVVETGPGARGQRWVAKRAAGLACFGGCGWTFVFRVSPFMCSAGPSPFCMLWVVSVVWGSAHRGVVCALCKLAALDASMHIQSIPGVKKP